MKAGKIGLRRQEKVYLLENTLCQVAIDRQVKQSANVVYYQGLSNVQFIRGMRTHPLDTHK